MKSVVLGKGLILASLIAQRMPAQECEGTEAIQSGHFYFTASSGQGAKVTQWLSNWL